MRKRLVITGMGVVCSCGTDVPSFMRSLRNGTPFLPLINEPRVAHFRARHAGLATAFDASRYAALLPGLAHPDRYALLAIAAAQEALDSAGIADCAGLAMGIFFATCSGPMHSIENHYASVIKNGCSDVPLFNTRYYSAARLLAHLLGISGPNATITTACSASINAIGTACDLINEGTVRIALAGGSDSFSLTTLAGFDGLKATCPQECAPFSKPYGMNLGEGGGFIVIEDFDHALNRGARILAEVLGYGSSNDAYHETSPDPTGRGPAASMTRALVHAGLEPAAITYVNAHGTGTEANDKTETKAIRKVFGPHADTLPMSSTKSITGHCLGAAGALELIAGIACSRERVLPSTANFSQPRDGCTLDFVGTAGRAWQVPGPFMKNNLAFGGNNATLIVTTEPAADAVCPDVSVDDPVCITGIGVVSPAGLGAVALYGFVQDAAMKTPLLQVGEIDPRSVDRRLDLRGVDRCTRFAALAAVQAISGAGLGNRPSERAEIGFYYHCAHGPAWAEADHINPLLHDDFHINRLASFPYIVPNSVTGTLCRLLSLTGHNSTFCLGPGAGLMGLQYALSAIRNGHVKMILTGCSDEVTDHDRAYARLDGSEGTPAEGAVMLMLEKQTSAMQRGATVLGTLLSCVGATDVSHPSERDPDQDVFEQCVRSALKTAMIDASQIGLICAPRDGCERGILSRLGVPPTVECIDVGGRIGKALSTYPLLNLVCALEKSTLEQNRSEKYILTLFSSQNGQHAATVIKTTV